MKWTSTRSDQNWILENFLKLSSNEDTLHPGILAQRLERGYKYHDLMRVYSRVTGRRSYARSWAKEGERLVKLAEESTTSFTKAEFYYRAAMCFGRAQHTIKGIHNADKIKFYESLRKNWDLFAEYFDEDITVYRGDNSSFIHFPCQRTTEGSRQKNQREANVLVIPGMDQFMQEVVFPYNNPWRRRGYNVFVMEGPGMVSQMMEENYLSVNNMSEAASKIINSFKGDWIVFGMSFGTRWGIEIAADNPNTVRACIGQMSNVGSTQVIFNQAQPNFRRIFMEMTNIHDDQRFDRYCKKVDQQLIRKAKQVKCPYLMVAGEDDELCSPETTIDFVKDNIEHGVVWMYRDCFHVMGEVCGDIYGPIADWAMNPDTRKQVIWR